MKTTASTILLSIMLMICACSGQEKQAHPDFTFVFATDIHLTEGRNAIQGFSNAMDSINALNPDFVITGGDLIMDALGVSESRADSFYTLYKTEVKKLKMPVYNTIGNHEVFGLYPASNTPTSHKLYGKKMYETHLTNRYYSFDYKGSRFMILDAIGMDTVNHKYYGNIDPEQFTWIKSVLDTTEKSMPIVLSTHIPFVTTYGQITQGSTKPNTPNIVVSNAFDVLRLFDKHQLKLVLQGHLHINEKIEINGTTFLTSSAISGRWWSGDLHGNQEGFQLITSNNGEFKSQFIDYGWEVKK